MESLLGKMTIPVINSSVAIVKLCEMEPCSAVYHYLKAIIGKAYNFPKRIVTALTQYFQKFVESQETLPVVWQQLLLTFCKQYGVAIDEMAKPGLISVAKKHTHKLITPDIVKELS
jgi:hypothetical protein